MSETLLYELLEILNQEKELYRKLYTIAEDKKETLINNEIENLFNHIENDREYIEKINDLENRRQTVMKNIDENFNLKSKELSYLDFVEKLPEKWAEKLNPVRDELINILEKFHVQNEENKRLIEEAVKFNKFSIDLIIDNLNNNNYTYNDSGQSSPRLLDKRG